MMNMTPRRPNPRQTRANLTPNMAPPPAVEQVTASPAMAGMANLSRLKRRKDMLAQQLMQSQEGDGPDSVIEGIADLGGQAINSYFLNKAGEEERQARGQANQYLAKALQDGGDVTGIFSSGAFEGLDPGQQALVSALLEKQMAAPAKAQRFEVGNNLVDEDGNVIYQGAPELKANPTREIKRDGRVFTQELTENGWQDLGSSPQWAPPAQTNINFPGNPTPDEIGRGKFAETAAKNNADALNTTVQGGVVAQKSLGDIRLLSQLADATPTGAGQNYINSIAGYAKRLGIDTSDVANLDASQQMTAIVNRIVPTLRPPGSGTMSDRDVQLFLESLPSLTNTPGGNKAIATNLEKIALRSVEEAKIADRALAGEITPSEARQQMLDLGPLDLSIPQAPPAPMTGNNFQRGGDVPKRMKFDAQGNQIQ